MKLPHLHSFSYVLRFQAAATVWESRGFMPSGMRRVISFYAHASLGFVYVTGLPWSAKTVHLSEGYYAPRGQIPRGDGPDGKRPSKRSPGVRTFISN